MSDDHDMLQSASRELGEALGLLDAAREALERAGDETTLRLAIARLGRIAAEVARVERECAGRTAAKAAVRH
jgi:hypothetical protein